MENKQNLPLLHFLFDEKDCEKNHKQSYKNSEKIIKKAQTSMFGFGSLILATVTSGLLIVNAINVNNPTPLQNINNNIAKNMDVKSVNANTFTWSNQDDKYLFSFSGSATNLDGTNIDFFIANYEVNEKAYNQIVNNTINRSDLENKQVNLENSLNSILRKIATVIEDAEFVSSAINENLAFKESENNNTTILTVSKACVEDNKICYYVVHCKQGTDSNENIGLISYLTKVTYSKTDELQDNPSKVFSLTNKPEKVETIKQNFKHINQYDYTQVDTFSSEFWIVKE